MIGCYVGGKWVTKAPEFASLQHLHCQACDWQYDVEIKSVGSGISVWVESWLYCVLATWPCKSYLHSALWFPHL